MYIIIYCSKLQKYLNRVHDDSEEESDRAEEELDDGEEAEEYIPNKRIRHAHQSTGGIAMDISSATAHLVDEEDDEDEEDEENRVGGEETDSDDDTDRLNISINE